MNTNKKSIIYAVLAASLYALNVPLSKLLLNSMPPSMMAGLLYLGGGIGMLILKTMIRNTAEQALTKKELPYVIVMIILDIAAPLLLMIGLTKSSAASASLLNNFEIVATSLIAFFLFKERISKKTWLSILLVTLASILLSIESTDSFHFSLGSLFVLGACICWGFENNCTRELSSKNPREIVIIKGIGSGLGGLLISFLTGERCFQFHYMIIALILGFIAYGLSIYYYIYAQRYLGAAKTSMYYAVAPFIGSFLSLIIFIEIPSYLFFVAFFLMIAGSYMSILPD